MYVFNNIALTGLTDFNVALVDWSKWTQKMDYTDLVLQLPTLAPYLVGWLKGLKGRGIIRDFDDVTLIGHSLGAQLIGYVGHRLNATVKRIIGTYSSNQCSHNLSLLQISRTYEHWLLTQTRTIMYSACDQVKNGYISEI